MGKREKKTGKGRLDKYYRLAKEQGYRARSAFKLIQLDKKYNFLSSARCLIDLCAAPGGWLQVAAKYMPPSNSIIVGVDLAPIKPIPRVVTFQEDITTPACRDKIRYEVKDWKADVCVARLPHPKKKGSTKHSVLHDGAPNVGSAWVQDAFTQAELVLSSLKLATEFLAPGGLFVTKIFRSKDYNSLLWVFNQLFTKVEATKPPSSRNVSAEIFVVCIGYKAPRKIDSKLLNPTYVFKEVDPTKPVQDAEAGPSTIKKMTQQATNIFHPEKKRRKREGYEDGDYTLFKLTPIEEFVTGRSDPIVVLSETSKFDFSSELGQKLLKSKKTTAEIKAASEDLKVLGKKDFKTLIRWRLAMREQLGLESKANAKPDEPKEVVHVSPLEEAENEDLAMEQELSRMTAEVAKAHRKERRRKNERTAREVLKLQLGMAAPMDIGMETATGGMADLFDLKNVDSKGQAKLSSTKAKLPELEMSSEEEEEEGSEDDGSEFSDEEDARLNRLESSLDNLYDDYQARVLKKDAKAKVRQLRQKKRLAEGAEWSGIKSDGEQSGSDSEYDSELERAQQQHNSDSDSDSDADSEEEAQDDAQVGQKRSRGGKLLTNLQDKGKEQDEKERRAAVWYDQQVFKDVPGLDALLQASEDEEEEEEEESDADSEDDKENFEPDEIIEWSSEDEDFDARSDSVEEVPLKDYQAEEDKQAERVANYGLDTAEAITLATQLVNREKTKTELIDDGFHRYAFDDKDQAPSWFLDDEMKHFRKNVPVTKEAVDILKSRMRALDARPIKKVAEAKARKKLRANRRIERLHKSADFVNENPDMSEKEKAATIQKLIAKAANGGGSSKKTKKNETKVVVARGAHRGNPGRPSGVSGRYKMVDARMKKEMRANKRVAKREKKKGGRKKLKK